jgi:hypothetical protein
VRVDLTVKGGWRQWLGESSDARCTSAVGVNKRCHGGTREGWKRSIADRRMWNRSVVHRGLGQLFNGRGGTEREKWWGSWSNSNRWGRRGGHGDVVVVVGDGCRQLVGAAEVGGGRTTWW